MLTLISLGLFDEKDMSVRAVETAKQCDVLYAEFYTTKLNTDAKKLSAFLGKPVTELKRSDLEEHSDNILKEAETKGVGLLVGGDALTATTHLSLLLEAKKRGIPTRLIHGSSIFTAVAETGLQLYKFGKTTTIAMPEPHYQPTSCYDDIYHNKQNGLHTLVLLDIKADQKNYMTVKEGLHILLEIENTQKKNLITPNTRIVAACQLGGNPTITYAPVKDLLNDKDMQNTPAVIIVPGKLHFTEEEFLDMLCSPKCNALSPPEGDRHRR